MRQDVAQMLSILMHDCPGSRMPGFMRHCFNSSFIADLPSLSGWALLGQDCGRYQIGPQSGALEVQRVSL